MVAGAAGRGWAYPGRGIVENVRSRLERMLLWRAWERMLEIEFVDRSVALAGKAFVSFFPAIIVVAAFSPPGVRHSIFTTLATRMGLSGEGLTAVKNAFASADSVRKALDHGANFDSLATKHHDPIENAILPDLPRDSLPAAYAAAIGTQMAGSVVGPFAIPDQAPAAIARLAKERLSG